MTTQLDIRQLPDKPSYCFAWHYDEEDDVYVVYIVFNTVPAYLRTSMVLVDDSTAMQLCDKLNSSLGLDRKAWTNMVNSTIGDGSPGP